VLVIMAYKSLMLKIPVVGSYAYKLIYQ
jgi:uncharacterized membrane protein